MRYVLTCYSWFSSLLLSGLWFFKWRGYMKSQSYLAYLALTAHLSDDPRNPKTFFLLFQWETLSFLAVCGHAGACNQYSPISRSPISILSVKDASRNRPHERPLRWKAYKTVVVMATPWRLTFTDSNYNNSKAWSALGKYNHYNLCCRTQ